jgi:hypothetical protein
MKLRKISLLLFVTLALTSCGEKNETKSEISCTKNEESYSNQKGITLNLSSQEWHLKQNTIGGVDVGVIVSGSIQGDSATIRTYGDGLISDWKINLNAEKKFKQDVGIFFTSGPSSEKIITAKTVIMVYKQQDTLKVELSSCPLQNIQLTTGL